MIKSLQTYVQLYKLVHTHQLDQNRRTEKHFCMKTETLETNHKIMYDHLLLPLLFFYKQLLITFIWKTRWIYMVEEFINILRVSAISCLFSVSSITGEKLLLSKTIFANLNIFGILKTNFLFRARVVSVQSSQKIYHLKSRCFARCLHLAIISDLLFSELKWSWWSANIISVFSVRHRSHTFDSLL